MSSATGAAQGSEKKDFLPAADDLQRLGDTDRYTGYVSSDGLYLKAFDGETRLARVVEHTAWQGTFGVIHKWVFATPDGQRFHGRNAGPCKTITIRKYKSGKAIR